jgi:hypothetical protein
MADNDLEQRILNNALSFIEGAARCQNLVKHNDGTLGAPSAWRDMLRLCIGAIVKVALCRSKLALIRAIITI